MPEILFGTFMSLINKITPKSEVNKTKESKEKKKARKKRESTTGSIMPNGKRISTRKQKKNAVKTIKKPAKKFLDDVRNDNVYFYEIPPKLTVEKCCDYLNKDELPDHPGIKGTRVIVKKLEGIINNIVTDIADKKKYKNNLTYNYLVELGRACNRFLNFEEINKDNFVKGIMKFEEIVQKFREICAFSDVDRSSFLNNKSIKNYLKTQLDILEASLNNLWNASRQKQ